MFIGQGVGHVVRSDGALQLGQMHLKLCVLAQLRAHSILASGLDSKGVVHYGHLSKL